MAGNGSSLEALTGAMNGGRSRGMAGYDIPGFKPDDIKTGTGEIIQAEEYRP
jgi:hypothetical protein